MRARRSHVDGPKMAYQMRRIGALATAVAQSTRNLPDVWGRSVPVSARARRDRSPITPERILAYVPEDGRADRVDVVAALEAHQLRPIVTLDRQEALRLAIQPDLGCIVVDLQSPHTDDLAFFSHLRSRTDASILVLMEEGGEDAIVRALEHGADAILTRPISVREFVARTRALLRRDGERGERPSRSLHVGRFEIDERSRTIAVDGREVSLKPKEFDLLVFLVHNRDRVLTREELMRAVWPTSVLTGKRTVDTHVHWLRAKLERDARRPEHFITVRRAGYCFTSPK